MPNTVKFQRKMSAMRALVKERLTDALERNADKVVAEMKAFLVIGYPAVARKTEIAWTWGDAPRGSIRVGTVRGRSREELTVTIYATAKQGSGFNARWFESGTKPRTQKRTGRRTGQITARPFFYPVFRANKQRVLSSLRGTLRRAVKKVNAM